MKWLLTLVTLAAIVFIALSAAGVFSSGLPVETAALRTGEIRQFVDEQGKTRLPTVHLITMPFDGRIQEITLREGAPVKAGEVVAQIVANDLDDAVAEAEAVVKRLDASLRENADKTVEKTSYEQSLKFVDSMVSTVKAAENQLTASRKRLDYAEQFFTRMRESFTRNAISRDEFDRADVRFVEAEVDLKQDELVVASFAAMKAATDLMPIMISQYMDRKDLTGAVWQKQREEAAVRLKQAETNRERGIMRSPIDGVVLERMESNERRLPGGSLLLKLGQLNDLEVEADILSQDVVAVREGQPAEICGPAVGAAIGQGVLGEVQRVYPAGFTKVSSLGVEQQRVKVVLRFAEGVLASLRSQRDLGVDYRVRVRIFTAKNEQAKLAPRSALFRGPDGGWQTFAVSDGRARLTSVKVGLMNDEIVEIVEGLQEGDLVVLAPESTLNDGAKVNPILSRQNGK